MSVASALRIQRAINLKRAERSFGAIVTTVAADFLHGGPPTFARAFDRRGALLATIQRREGEAWATFKTRAREAAGATAGAASLFIGGHATDWKQGGGIPQYPRDDESDLPRGVVTLSEAAVPHQSQLDALRLIRSHQRVALVCGRRWGKSAILITLALDAALSGKRVGVFAPTRTLLSPLLMEIARALRPVPGTSVNTVLGEIRLANGGHCDFWSVDHTGRAGRGRRYHLVLIDEAAHDEGYLKDVFPTAIAPTLLDYRGAVIRR